MIKSISLSLACMVLLATSAHAQNSISIVDNYNDWKWDSVFVAKNDYISLAVVPQAAGRILEYNLGEVPSLWVNPKLLGQSFSSSDLVKQNEWRNFGGYRLVPMPFDNCSIDKNGNRAKRWPPPVVIGDAPYTAAISSESGQLYLDVSSGIQELPVPQWSGASKSFMMPEQVEEELQYKRRLHITPTSSLVYIKHTLINQGSGTVTRGIMTSSQHVSRSAPDLTDGENYVAYVPFDTKYKLPNGKPFEIMGDADSRWRYIHRNRMPLDKNNPEHVAKYYNHGTNWNGEVAPGIYEVEYDYYLMSGLHIISSESWICYVDKINQTAFAKIIEPFDPSLAYDEGVNVSVFCSGLETGYIETEVRTPLYTLEPGQSFDYLEIHGAAQIGAGAVLDVNMAGIISQKLQWQADQKTWKGQYGVFHAGEAVLSILDKRGQSLRDQALGSVDPLTVFEVNEIWKKDKKAQAIELKIQAKDGKEYLLDRVVLGE